MKSFREIVDQLLKLYALCKLVISVVECGRKVQADSSLKVGSGAGAKQVNHTSE
jgi:hypothetical protein